MAIYQLVYTHNSSNTFSRCVCQDLGITTVTTDSFLNSEWRREVLDPDEDIVINRLSSLWEGGSRVDPFAGWLGPEKKASYTHIVEHLQGVKKLVAVPGRYALADDALPLNIQWQILKKHAPQLHLPRYQFQRKWSQDPPAEGLFASDPSLIYRWNEQQGHFNGRTWDTFFAERFDERPIVVSFLGEQIQVHGDPDARDRVLSSFHAVRKVFPYTFGEVLFFLKGRNPYFWCISHAYVMEPSILDSRWGAEGLSLILEQKRDRK